MHTRSTPFATVLGGLAERVRWPALPAMPRDSVLTMVPCMVSAVAAGLVGSFDWCYGEVRITLALCMSGAGASGSLLLCWRLNPETMGRSAAWAAIGGLSAAVPLLSFV